MLVNFAVIVMRESEIHSYDPGFRSPLYPWTQVVGIIVSFILIIYMGWLAVLFTAGISLGCLIWYFYYARGNVARGGAIFHWFRRLGTRQDEGLDREFRGIMKEKGLRARDPYEEVVTRSAVIDLKSPCEFAEVVDRAARLLAEKLPNTVEEVRDRFGHMYAIEPVSSKGETGTRRTISIYLMEHNTSSR